MFGMNKAQLLKAIDSSRVEAAIREAEQGTTGEICVSVAPYFWGNVRRTAEKTFLRLGMTNTRDSNGVLILVVPARKQFVILGDAGVKEAVGDAYWETLRDTVQHRFRAGQFTEGLVEAIQVLGDTLRTHFPTQAPGASVPEANPNELPDAVEIQS